MTVPADRFGCSEHISRVRAVLNFVAVLASLFNGRMDVLAGGVVRMATQTNGLLVSRHRMRRPGKQARNDESTEERVPHRSDGAAHSAPSTASDSVLRACL